MVSLPVDVAAPVPFSNDVAAAGLKEAVAFVLVAVAVALSVVAVTEVEHDVIDGELMPQAFRRGLSVGKELFALVTL